MLKGNPSWNLSFEKDVLARIPYVKRESNIESFMFKEILATVLHFTRNSQLESFVLKGNPSQNPACLKSHYNADGTKAASENSSQISFSKGLFRALFLAILRGTPGRSPGREEPGSLENGQAKIPHRFPSQKAYFEHFFQPS